MCFSSGTSHSLWCPHLPTASPHTASGTNYSGAVWEMILGDFLGTHSQLLIFFFSGELPYLRKLACWENYDIACPNWGQPEPVAGRHENTKGPSPLCQLGSTLSCESQSRAPQAFELRRLQLRPSLAKPLQLPFSRKHSLQTHVQNVTSQALLLDNLTSPANRCDPDQVASRSFACIR